MRLYMDSCESKDRGRILKVLAELTERTGFTSAVNTVNEAVRMNATDPDSLETLYRRTYADVPVLPPLDSGPDIPNKGVIPFRNDLQKLDAALHKEMPSIMAEIENSIAQCCKQLRLSTNFAGQHLRRKEIPHKSIC